MSLPDIIFTVGGIILALAMVPTLFLPTVVPYPTSVPLAVVLTIFAGAYASLGLYGAAVTAGVQGALWGFLVARRIRVVRSGSLQIEQENQ